MSNFLIPDTQGKDNERKQNFCESVELFRTITELLKKDSKTTDDVLKSQFIRFVDLIEKSFENSKLNRWERFLGMDRK